MNDTLQIIRAALNDVDLIAEIEQNCFNSEAWSAANIQSAFDSRNIWFIAKKGNETIGYINFSHVLDESELNRVAVLKAFRNNGIACLLIEHGIRELKSLGINTVFIEVRSSNTAARNLYDKIGFKAYMTRKEYYCNPVEDALLMQMQI